MPVHREDAPHFDELNDDDGVWSEVPDPSPTSAPHRPRTAASVRSMASNIYRSANSLKPQMEVCGCVRALDVLNHQKLLINCAHTHACPLCLQAKKFLADSEMMTIHGEVDVLPDNTRPLHLKKFNVGWIGAPKVPLNEIAQTRSAFNTSKHSTEVSLPPVAKKGEEMLQARINYEQVMEGLRLNYVAARRQERQEARAEAARRREELQMRSSQCQRFTKRGPSRPTTFGGLESAQFDALL